jgi:hypothetical protein
VIPRTAKGLSIALVLCATHAGADPLRLRGDALVETRSPVGLLVLHGEDRVKPWIDVEAVAWTGINADPQASGDVQTMTVRLRDPSGRGEVRVGRFVYTSGAIRPLQLDGARALVRAPSGTNVETFVGSPVRREYDFAYGGRISQRIGDVLSLGGAYILQRKDGVIGDREVGPDFAFAPTRWLDVVGRLAWDLENPGVADALASASARSEDVRFEVFGTHRSPGRLLPATSLFSVLGDFPSTTTGGTLRWRIAPRLDLVGTGAAVIVDRDVGGMGTFRATLALDDDFDGTLGFELRRQYVSDAKWSGARALASLPVSRSFRASTEVELVRPDHPVGTSKVWPWALVALGWRASSTWTVAGAFEGLRTRDDRNELHAMLRATWVR